MADDLHGDEDTEANLMAAILLAVIVAALVAAIISMAHGRELYQWQYAQYSDEQRNWFKTERSPSGVPCCDVADGHLSTWIVGESETGYMVAVDNPDSPGGFEWVPVPKSALIVNSPSPDGETWVWYIDQENNTDAANAKHHKWYVRCFVPGNGA